MPGAMKEAPLGLRLLEKFFSKCCHCRLFDKLIWHQAGVLLLTYLAYTCYHLTRKPISVVKSVLNQNCSDLIPPPNIIINDTNKDTWCCWAPFDTPDAPALLGTLDSAFLFAYAGAMFVSGFVAERVNLRYFLSLGMIFSGISCYLFGIARPSNIHALWYFAFIQALAGIFQTSGWPGVVTVIGNWFGKGKRGLIFGIWNSHTSLGNILGSILAGYYVETDWGLSFMIPGVIMGLIGFLLFLFLAPCPSDVGIIPPGPQGYRKIDAAHSSDEGSGSDDVDSIHSEDPRITYRSTGRHSENNYEDMNHPHSETSPMLSVNRNKKSSDKAIGFMGALSIPGVIEYSLALFFAKLVSYTFLFWLPLYIKYSTSYDAETSANISTLFDVGGIFGAIIAGVISDYSGMSAVTCTFLLLLAAPALFLYDFIGNINLSVNIILLIITGILVNGPYALITTAVSAELGTHPSLGDDSKALATVTAIIDGTGSIGAAVGPFLAGLVSSRGNWHDVFYMLIISDLIALIFLLRLVRKELRLYIQRRRVI